MNIKIERYGSCLLMKCSGDLCADSQEAFAADIDKHLESDLSELVLCMECVTFVDSIGLEYLLDLRDRLASMSSRLSLTNLPDNIRKIMEVTRLDGSFEIMEDSSDILKSLT